MSHVDEPIRPAPMLAGQSELAARIAQAVPVDGEREIQRGVFFRRNSRAGDCTHGVCDPAFCSIAQGGEVVQLGVDRFRYDPAHYLICTMELPLVGQIIEASPSKPYLGFRLVLDPLVVTSVVMESAAHTPRGDECVKAIDCSRLDEQLLDATLRLARMLDKPDEYRVLGALVVREIIYRLLLGAQGSRLRHLATLGGQAHRMARAVKKLRDHFNKPLKIEAIARECGMSVSGFHAHFKTATSMSPLQFQKQLRLQEARRLMLGMDFDSAEAGYRVGYDDASHFNRDYKRHFGQPPMRDIEGLRNEAVSRAV